MEWEEHILSGLTAFPWHSRENVCILRAYTTVSSNISPSAVSLMKFQSGLQILKNQRAERKYYILTIKVKSIGITFKLVFEDQNYSC